MKHDIKNIEDICLLVDSFYEQVREDSLIGELFNNIIKEWNIHLEKMYRFWQTILLDEHTYEGSPFAPHANMPIRREHFERRLVLWRKSVDKHFVGKIADEAKWRGDKMASLFLSKIEYYRNSNIIPLT